MPTEHRTPHLSYVLRRPSPNLSQSLPFDHRESGPPIAGQEIIKSEPVSPVTRHPTAKYEQQPNQMAKSEKKAEVANSEQLVSSSSGNAFTNWFNGLSSTQKLVFKVSIAIGIAVMVIAAIVIPIGVIYGSPKTDSQIAASTTNSSKSLFCSSTTAIGYETPYRSSISTVLYPFDGNMIDLITNNIGIPYGITLPSAVNQGYINQGLQLTSSAQQYVVIPSLNFSQSFTFQVWVYFSSMSLAADMAIFSQCDPSSICLTLMIKNARFVVSFDSMNSNSYLLGTTVLNINSIWVHATIVYDATLRQQQLYVNGRIDAISSGSVDPYRGTLQGSLATIGRHPNITSGFVFLDGRIDHLMISLSVVRSPYQIQNDATLTVYYPFDNTATNNDYGVHLCNGIMAGVAVTSSGRTNQALSFSTVTSYFQSQCYASQRLLEPAYTVSLWIRPTMTTNGGSLVHLSTAVNGGGTCFDLLVFTAGGTLVVQHMTAWGNMMAIQGPLISINVWTHIAVVYGTAYGIRLYINGQLAVTTLNINTVSVANPMSPMFITLGNIGPMGPLASITCSNGTIPIASGSYNGLIDDFRLYNRELSVQDLCVLANP